jgi:hypothetical protein
MQTNKIVENSKNDNTKSITNLTLENILSTQVEDMSDIPGIRVSMATIVDSSPIEEQQNLFDDNTPNFPNKVINNYFSSIATLPEEQHQIKPSKISNQQEPQSTELTEANVTNEISDVSPEIDIKNEVNEESKDNVSNMINQCNFEIETLLTS